MSPPARAIGLGALAWALFAALYVVLHPLVIDETVLSAQILCGLVDYPAGHPHEVFHRQAFSLPNQLSAVILRLTGDVEHVSRARNFLVVFLSGFAPFLVGTLASRRALVGLAASAIALAGGLDRFQGVYPTFVFPTFYSHGHVGALGALVTVALLSGGFRRTGAFILGLFPAIHPLLGALVWLWALPWFGSEFVRARGAPRRELRGAALFLALGLLVTAGSFTFSRAMVPTEPPLELYAPGPDAEGELVRAHFIEFTDPHRTMPAADAGTFLFGYAANTVAFAAVAVLLFAVTRGARDRDAPRWIALFGVAAWAVVWGARSLELALGHLPDALETAMPYRLSNLSAALLVPLGAAALVRAAERVGRTALTAASAALAGLVLAGGAANHLALSDPDAARYGLAAGIGLLGSAFAAGVVLVRSPAARIACALAAVALFGIFLPQRARSGFQGADLLALSFAVAAVAFALARRGAKASGTAEPLPGQALLALACIAAIAAAARRADPEPSSLVTPFDREVAAWLGEHAEPGDLLLAPLQPRTQLQAKTGHPVLLELGTLWLMPYMPELSSAIGRMTADLYGVDYADRAALERLAPDGLLRQHDPEWSDVWHMRAREEWRALGAKYDFNLVVAPTEWNVDLVPLVVSVEWTLYRVPDA